MIEKLEQVTIETRIKNEEYFPMLDDFFDFYTHIYHSIFRDFITLKKDRNFLKKEYIQKYQISGRLFNSMISQAEALADGTKELTQNHIETTKRKIISLENQIKKLEKNIIANKKKHKQILDYRKKIKAYKQAKRINPKTKKPKMLKSIKKVDDNLLKIQINKDLFSLHHKKRALEIKKHKLTKLNQNLSNPSICFGSKDLFKKQHFLQENNFENHDEWLELFREKRCSSMLFIGSSDESFGNQLLQYNKDSLSLKIRLPDFFEEKYGKETFLENIEFPENLRSHFYHALSNSNLDPNRKNQKTNLPITYRIIKRFNENTKTKAYYIQASFAVPANKVKTNKLYGSIAVDLNADHLAIAETDGRGNYLNSFQIPVNLDDKTTDQRSAILGDAIAIIVKHASKLGKPIVIERLDFTEKKNRMQDVRSKKYRKMISSFAYSIFHKKMKSCCNKHSVEMITVNPAFSSLLGFYKYQGLKISTHEKAAII